MNLCKATVTSCLVLGIMGAGCGDKKKDNGGNAEARGTTTAPASTADPAAANDDAGTAPEQKEMPSLTADVERSTTRIVNLAMKDGAPVAIDIWEIYPYEDVFTDKAAPVKLVEDLAFGASSDWLPGATKRYQLTAYVAGTGPDSKEKELGTLGHVSRNGSHSTLVFTESGHSTFVHTDDDAADIVTPDAPPAGKGYVAFSSKYSERSSSKKAMRKITGGSALRVGDGKTCLRQRNEDMSISASDVRAGEPWPVEVDLAPGTHTITLHKGGKQNCIEANKVHELDLVVKADSAQLVLVYTPDGKVLQHSVHDTPVNSAKPYGTNKELNERAAERAAKEAAKEAAAR